MLVEPLSLFVYWQKVEQPENRKMQDNLFTASSCLILKYRYLVPGYCQSVDNIDTY